MSTTVAVVEGRPRLAARFEHMLEAGGFAIWGGDSPPDVLVVALDAPDPNWTSVIAPWASFDGPVVGLRLAPGCPEILPAHAALDRPFGAEALILAMTAAVQQHAADRAPRSPAQAIARSIHDLAAIADESERTRAVAAILDAFPPR